MRLGLVWMIPATILAQPPGELAAAVEALGKSAGYRWETRTMMKGGPDAALMEINGAYEKTTGCLVKSNVGNQEIAAAVIGGKSSASIGDGWRGTGQFSGKDEKSVRAREMISPLLPHDELAKAADAAAGWNKQTDGSWVGAVDSAVARDMVVAAMSERGMPAAAMNALQCKGSRLQVWMSAGLPKSYQLDFEVEVSLGLMKKTMKRKTLTTISAVGKTKVEIPATAAAAMSAPKP
jgi:hypothetical protein